MTRTVEDWLDRDGLSRAERLAILAELAVGSADWPRLETCVRLCRSSGLERSILEETLLQAVLFFGFPRVVTAFQVLQRCWPAVAPAANGVDLSKRRARGLSLFRRIYAAGSEEVLEMLGSLHGELQAFVLEEAYGRVLSRPGLDVKVRELLAVAALTVQDQTPQLVAHGRGALHCGATERELAETLLTATDSDRALAERLLRKIGRERGDARDPQTL